MALPYVSVSASSSGNRYITVTGRMNNNGTSTLEYSRTATVSVDGVGSQSFSKTFSYGQSVDWFYTFDVGTSYDYRTYTCRASYDLSDISHGATDASCTVGVAAVARPTHTVKYDANGGTGAPANQTKTYGYVLTLSSVKPTRDGYTFAGWGTSANSTDVKYTPGGQYGADVDITLYAVWTLIATCTIVYNANGGANAPVSQTHIMNTTSYISEGKPTRDKYVFCGWSTSNTATKGLYLYGSKYVNNDFSNGDTITLYAVWVKKPPVLHVATEGQKTVKAIYVNVPDGKSLKSVFFKTG